MKRFLVPDDMIMKTGLPGEIGMNFMCLFGNGRFKPANDCRQIL
jgi:hypothetical protein